ncbi:metallophosphoesterase family protein [Calditrichota bacterium]
MRLAIISDIHANLPALEVVHESIKLKGVDRILCLGDMVGYGARPQECVDFIRDNEILAVKGNHDEAAAADSILKNFNPLAGEAVKWTRLALSEDARSYLDKLPLTLRIEDVTLAHSSPNDPELWNYLFKIQDAEPHFAHFDTEVCFVGHTHYPVEFGEPGGSKRIINVGSVGQPRDRNNKASYGLYDIGSRKFEWVRLDYPFEKAAQQIIDAGLPPFNANRLMMGI